MVGKGCGKVTRTFQMKRKIMQTKRKNPKDYVNEKHKEKTEEMRADDSNMIRYVVRDALKRVRNAHGV
jgi:hypothetical protein